MKAAKCLNLYVPITIASILHIIFSLKRLNLENNKIRDKGAIYLFEGLKDSSKIKKLNLSKNHITDASSNALFSFLSLTQSLEVLYLHWNYLK